jgi:cytochrome c oxidase assembly factor CtaG/polyferredoxin
MDLAADAVLRSWPFDPWLWAGLLICAAVYLHGWRVLARRDPSRWPATKPLAFLAGLLALFLALGSPLEPFTSLLLQAHMAQHLLLVMAAPPLLWLGAPFFPLVRGLPVPARSALAPLLRSSALHALFSRLTHPVWAGLIFFVVTWAWHVPALYQLALGSDGWHYVQHVCFLGAGLLFWHPVVRPYPAKPAWSKWLLVPYLILTDVQNTALSALLTFADAPWYPHYATMPRIAGTVLDDQAAAGVLMWVPGSIAYLVPLAVIGLRLMFGEQTRFGSPPHPQPLSPEAGERGARRVSLPVLGHAPPRFDLLRLPVIGRFLRWRHARLALQMPLLLAAGVVILDGFLGPDVAPLNLAGVLPWIHWRGLLVLGLLAVGNVFCLGCPFLLPRTLARRWLPATRPWPRWLRNKWPAVALFGLFLWAYEAFSLWDQPWMTAMLALAYFVAAFVIDGVFRHASFCKFVCPIGQFNFVASLVSPTEVRVRDSDVCDTCRTKDCIRGSPKSPGCELALYLPRKAGNMDCTLCLDCVHACPHDNVEVGARAPGAELWADPQRSGVGKFSQRTDLAALVLLFVFGAFANAAGMIEPVVAWQDQLRETFGFPSTWPIVTGFYVVALGVPMGLLLAPRRFVYCLVPLGAALWLSHYSFHFFTSYNAVVPATQRAAFDLGWLAEPPAWVCNCCAVIPAWLIRAEILALDLGLLLSLYTAWRISERRLMMTLPWATLIAALFALGVWILVEPMQMRGTMAG